MTNVVVLGGACIDQYENQNALGSFLEPRLGGDAANTAVRLATARNHGWGVGDVSLAALVGMQAKEGGVGGQYIIDQLTAAGVQHDSAFRHNGLVRNAVWRWNKESQKHRLDQAASDADPNYSYLEDPVDLIENIAPCISAPEKGCIVLAASMATTLAWPGYSKYAETPLVWDAILITSPNTREIKPDDTITIKGHEFNKREIYNEELKCQFRRSDIVVVSEDDLQHMYPDLLDDDVRLAHLKSQIKSSAVLILSRGKAGLEINIPGENQLIQVKAPVINNAQSTVGAGGAALTGLVLGLAAAKIEKNYQIKQLGADEWRAIGQTMAAFSEYHLRSGNPYLNGEKPPAFPRPVKQCAIQPGEPRTQPKS